MLKDVVNFGKQLFALTRDVQQNKADIKEVREEVKELRQEINQMRQEFIALARIVERMTFEMQRQHENAAQERKIQQLEIDLRLARFESKLPPGDTREDKSE
jgi:hypothetical protein